MKTKELSRAKKIKRLDSGFWILDSRRGFTIIELLVSIAIIVILGAVTFGSFLSTRNSGDLTNTAKQIVALLRQTQTQSVQDYQSTAWGVHFANSAGTSSATFYASFSGAYSATSTSAPYRLPATVAFMTSTLPASSTRDVLFTPITGFTVSTSIGLYLRNQPTMSSTIRISSSGVVSY